MTTFYVIWAIVGHGVAAALTLRFWRPDPPKLVRIIPVHIGGIVGGIVAGALTHRGLLQLGPLSDVIVPALITVAAGGASGGSLVAFILARGNGPSDR